MLPNVGFSEMVICALVAALMIALSVIRALLEQRKRK